MYHPECWATKQVNGNPYPLRMWIEANFKDWKRGGLHLEQAKTRDPQRLSLSFT
jgi:hypothetical protein